MDEQRSGAEGLPPPGVLGPVSREPVPPPSAWPVAPVASAGERTGTLAALESFAARALLGCWSRLPGALDRGLRQALAVLLERLDRRHSSAGERFIEQALRFWGRPPLGPAERRAQVRAAYRHFLAVIVESERFAREVPWQRTFEHVELCATPCARELLLARRPALVLSCHVGNWELGSLFGARLGLSPMYAIAKPVKNRYLSEAIAAAREKRGIRILYRRGAMAEVPAVIAAGGSVAMLLDQRANVKPVLAPFFGRTARCDRSAGVLIRRVARPLLFGACYRLPGPSLRFRLELGPVLEPGALRDLSAEALAARINAEFERMIAAQPEQYFWLHDRYRDAPPDGSAPSS